MRHLILILALAICLLCDTVGAQGLLAPIGERDWLSEKLKQTMGGQDLATLFEPILRKGSLVAETLDEPKSQPRMQSPPPISDLTPPMARPLQPLVTELAIEKQPSADDSRVVLASATTEILEEEESGSHSSNDAKKEETNSTDAGGGSESKSSSELAVLQDQIKQFKATIGSDEQIDSSKKNERLERLTAAQSSLNKAATLAVKKVLYRSQLEQYPAELKMLSKATADESKPESLEIDADTTSDSLQPELQSLRQKLQDEEQDFDNLDSEFKKLNDRITEIPSIRARLAEELVKVDEILSTLSQQDEDLDVQMNWFVQSSKRIALQAELDMLDSESLRQKLAGKYLPTKRDEASRQVKKFEARISTYEQAIADLRRDEMKQQAEQVRWEAINAHPALKDIANRNQELTKLRSNITERIQAANKELAQVKGLVESLVENKQELEKKIDVAGGVTHSSGMALVESRRRLESPFESLARIKAIRSERKTVNVAVLTLEEEREPLVDPVEFIKQQIGQGGNANFEQEKLSVAAVRFAETKLQYLDGLLNDYRQYRGLLEELEVSRNDLVAQIAENRKYIDEMALWVRNTAPISIKDVRTSVAGLRAFFEPEDWLAMGNVLRQRVTSKPHETALGACGLMVVVLMTRRLKQK